MSDGIALTLQGDEVLVTKPLYAGKCFAQASFENSKIKIVLMRPNQLPVDHANSSLTAEVTDLQVPQLDLSTIVKEVVKGASEKLDLTEANIIVAGGRGFKEAANFKLLNELASCWERLSEPLEPSLMRGGFLIACKWAKPEKQLHRPCILQLGFQVQFNI